MSGPSATLHRSVSELWLATRLTAGLLLLAGLLFPLLLWGISRIAFTWQAEGSLLRGPTGSVVGSDLIGQTFTRAEYFHPRPSVAAYNAAASAGSNIGPSNPQLLGGNGGSYAGIVAYAAAYRRENNLDTETPLPSDAVTASGSGLDPHISPANAELQAARVTGARRGTLSDASVRALVRANTRGRTFGFLGEARVNVLRLNMALDSASAAARHSR